MDLTGLYLLTTTLVFILQQEGKNTVIPLLSRCDSEMVLLSTAFIIFYYISIKK